MYNITDDGKSIRQIVPADFTFLSQADGQVVKAIEGVLKLMFGYGGVYPPSSQHETWSADGALIVKGVDVAYSNSIATLNPGVILYDGRLWDLESGASWGYDATGSHGLEASFEARALVFEEKVVEPSPVYGASDSVTVSPHVNSTCRIAEVSNLSGAEKSLNLKYVYRIPYLEHFNKLRRVWEYSYNHNV